MTTDEKLEVIKILAANGAQIAQLNNGDGYQYFGCQINQYSNSAPSTHACSPVDADVVTSDPEDLSDDKWVEIQKVFKGPRSIISILRALIADCLKPADYACMIAVLDDFGLVRDRYDFAGITNALAILGRNVEPNSIRYKLNQLPSDFRSWDKTQFKSDYSFCSSLELHIKDIPGYTYRY